MLWMRIVERSLRSRARLPGIRSAREALEPEAAKLLELASSPLGLERAAIRARKVWRFRLVERKQQRLPRLRIVQARMASADQRRQLEVARSRREPVEAQELLAAERRRVEIALKARPESVEGRSRMR